MLDLSTGTEEGRQLTDKFHRIERGRKNIPDTRLEALVPLLPVETRGRGDDERGSIVYRRQFSDGTADLQTQDVGQFIVQDDEVGPEPGSQFDRLPTGVGFDNGKSRRLEDALHRPRGPLLAVDEKYDRST